MTDQWLPRTKGGVGRKEKEREGREERGRARERGRVIHINKRNGLDLNRHILKV